MNQKNQQDFEKKKDWITQMAEFNGWSFVFENPSIGHIQYQKDKLLFNVWTTKMTASMVCMSWQKIYKNISMDVIEKTFQDPYRMFQIPKNKEGRRSKVVYHKNRYHA